MDNKYPQLTSGEGHKKTNAFFIIHIILTAVLQALGYICGFILFC